MPIREKGKKLVFVDTGKIKGASILPDRYKKLFLNKQIVSFSCLARNTLLIS